MVSLSDNSDNSDRDRSNTLACSQKVSAAVEEPIIFAIFPLKQKNESSSCLVVSGTSKASLRPYPVDFGNGLKLQKCRAQLWGNFNLGRRREGCRFFQTNGLLA